MRTFIFDMDGTLADTMLTHQLAWDALLPKLGLAVDRGDFFSWSAGLTNRGIFPRLLGEDVALEEINRLSDDKESLFRDLYRTKMTAVNGVETFLQQSQSGLAVWRRDGCSAAKRRLSARRIESSPPFSGDCVQRRCEAGNARSRNNFAGAQLLGAQPKDCVVFEDAPAGIEAARRAGMACVVIASTLTGGQIGALADTRHVVHVVDDFTDPALSALFA